jgi:diguanylate cyclase (GGDEF)-like protein
MDVAVGGSTFSDESINPLGIFQHREYGMVFFLGTPNGEYAGGGYRMVIDMSGLTDDAWALFYRSVLFGGALLLVSLVTLWVLLRYLVARPLRAYSHTALLIAEGAPLRIPNLAKNEIGELGMAINSMADALREQATVDALTGLLNVRHFKAEFPAMLASAKATGEPLSIVNVDVDNLKPVNDTYGHAAGDQVLKAIGSCLLNWGGENAVHWRVGGDEFLVALPGVGAAEAAELAASLEALIATKQITVKGEEIALSVSAGTASYPEDAESMARLVAVADERMYERKARSRDAA